MQSLTPSRSEIAAHRTPKAPRRDPAPSRLTYKVHRLWLTPLYRSLMRVGLPTFVILTAVGWYFADPSNRYAVAEKFEEVRRSIETRPEFMVRLMAVEGATPVVDTAIRDLVPVEFPVSSFDLDLVVIQSQIAALDVIERADVRIRPGGILEIAVVEREPALVWRAPHSIELIDATGHRVATVTERRARADLPLIAGPGADQAVPEALALLRAATPLADRLRGLVRVGERRWDVWLSGSQVIQLPEQNPVSALEQVLALDQAQDLLARDVSHIDMRNPQRPTLRLLPRAVEEMRQIRSLWSETR
jgi:cell division protein FtsQ